MSAVGIVQYLHLQCYLSTVFGCGCKILSTRIKDDDIRSTSIFVQKCRLGKVNVGDDNHRPGVIPKLSMLNFCEGNHKAEKSYGTK